MTNTRLEQDLKDVLVERAWSIPPTLDPYGRTARAIAVDRRRRSVLLAAGVAVVTVLAVAPIAIVATFDGSAGDDGNYLVGLAHSASSDTGYDYDRVTVYIAGPGDAAATATATLRADEMADRQV